VKQLPEDTIIEGNWFFQLLLSKGEHSASAIKFKKLLDVGSLILDTAARTAWNNNFSPCPPEITQEEKTRAAQFMADLSERRTGKPGPVKLYPHRLQLRFSDAERIAIEKLTASGGEDTQNLIRRLLREAASDI
jgi:hypothetical protein